MPSIFCSVLLISLLTIHSFAIWPFEYWNLEEMAYPVLSTEINGTHISLDNLNDDVLNIICDFVQDVQDMVSDDPRAPDGPAMPGQFPTDVGEQYISALRSLSMTNKRFRHLTSPLLFQSIRIDGTWREASRGLQVVENCPAASAQARTFIFNVFEENAKKIPPKNLDYRLLNALQIMNKLSTIHLSLPEYQTDIFANTFSTGSLNIPTAHTLVLASFNDFLIEHCSNVETVSSDGWQFLHSHRGHYNDSGEWIHFGEHSRRLIVAASKAKNLSYFEMNDFWGVTELQEVLVHMPDIKRLAMPGGKYRSPLQRLLPILAQFNFLEELILSSASNLHVGFDPPGCGNIYTGPGGEERMKQVQEQAQRAENSVAREIFQTCVPLKKLWVGDWSCAEPMRDEVGNITDIRWVYGKRPAPSGWVV